MKYFFNNQRFSTINISNQVSLDIQIFIWDCIDKLVKNYPEVDYLQIFTFSKQNKIFLIEHKSEVPYFHEIYYLKYKDEYYNLINEKIYVIDDLSHSTMLFADEY